MIPATFEQITAAGVTVAWDPSELDGAYDMPLRPTTLAYAVAGILEEAAALTGSERRAQLTVIVDASTADLQARMHLPVWVEGAYDGGAVNVGAARHADLGVRLATLRHEVMHAQIHAGVGCVPFWFDEGVASYFARETRAAGWIAMLRGPAGDLRSVEDPQIFDQPVADVRQLYSLSLAMVVYLVHHGGERAITEAARVAQSGVDHRLWSQVQPRATIDDVVAMLADKLFALPVGPALDAIVRGPVCCSHLRSPTEITCHAQAGEPTRGEICRTW